MSRQAVNAVCREPDHVHLVQAYYSWQMLAISKQAYEKY